MKIKLICAKHDLIISLCEDILYMDFDKPFKKKLKAKIRKIKSITNKAKIDGQSMEDRLNEYHDGIIDIGFKRDK